MNLCINVTVVLLVFLHIAWTNSLEITKREMEREIMKKLLTGYDNRIIPAKYGPVYVKVGIYVRSLIELDADKNLYKIQLNFRQQWYDRRFHFEDKHGPDFYVRPRYVFEIWTPDLFFRDGTGRVHGTITPDEVRIYPNAQVDCRSSFSMNVYWPMDLTNFPMDKQVFEMEIATHENKAKDIAIHWLSVYETPREAIRISKMFHFPPFTVTSLGAYPCISKTNATNEDSCKKMMIHFTRDITHYLLRAFIPTASLVILSWIPFWLHPRSMAPRLTMTIALLGIFVVLAVAEGGPRTFYLRAMDVWMGSCFCFIFCALIEIVVASNSITAEDEKDKMLSTENMEGIRVNGTTKTDSRHLTPKYTPIPTDKPGENKCTTQARKIDVISRILFPVAFAIFNLIFWLFYATK